MVRGPAGHDLGPFVFLAFTTWRFLSATYLPLRMYHCLFLRICRRLSKDLSFPTIAGSDSNGAIIHYSAERGSCRTVGRDSMLLLDSGAQVSHERFNSEDNTSFFRRGQQKMLLRNVLTTAFVCSKQKYAPQKPGVCHAAVAQLTAEKFLGNEPLRNPARILHYHTWYIYHPLPFPPFPVCVLPFFSFSSLSPGWTVRRRNDGRHPNNALRFSNGQTKRGTVYKTAADP